MPPYAYEPSASEMLRRIEEITRRQEDLMTEIRADRAALAATYVRLDVYRAERAADTSDVTDLVKRQDTADAFRRQILAGVSVGIIGMAANVVLTLSQVAR
ncbi:MAG: hypothetical protein ACRC0L_12870 [Angustibacter sp.]